MVVVVGVLVVVVEGDICLLLFDGVVLFGFPVDNVALRFAASVHDM